MRKTAHTIFALILGGGTLTLIYVHDSSSIPFSHLPHELGLPAFIGIGLAATVIGARLPDILEPGNTRGHRGLFHSKGMAFLLTGCIIILLLMYRRFGDVSPFLILLCIGYLSHLFLDGLPFGGIPD